MKVTDNLHGERFFSMKQEADKLVRYATPLFLVLILVEFTDLIFAVDSIPAIFGTSIILSLRKDARAGGMLRSTGKNGQN